MNKAHKDKLQRAKALVNEAKNLIEEVRDYEQETYEEKSDDWRESDAGSNAEEIIVGLTDLVDNLEGTDSELDNAIKP